MLDRAAILLDACFPANVQIFPGRLGRAVPCAAAKSVKALAAEKLAQRRRPEKRDLPVVGMPDMGRLGAESVVDLTPA